MIYRLTLLIAIFCLSVPAVAVETGDVAPAFTGADESGNAVNFPDMVDGKPSIILFWATWCSYCKAFMPYMEQIQKDYGGEKINVILINHKERGAGDPAAYIESLSFPLTTVLNGDAIGDAYTVDFIPGLMIAGADGRIAWKRESTDLPPGQKVAEFWDMKVREQLDKML